MYTCYTVVDYGLNEANTCVAAGILHSLSTAVKKCYKFPGYYNYSTGTMLLHEMHVYFLNVMSDFICSESTWRVESRSESPESPGTECSSILRPLSVSLPFAAGSNFSPYPW